MNMIDQRNDDNNRLPLNPIRIEEVGFLRGVVPEGQRAEAPLVEVTRKLVYYMDEAANRGKFEDTQISQMPDGFYNHHSKYGERGFHVCDVEECAQPGAKKPLMSGEFAWKSRGVIMVIPTGIVHYLLDHNLKPNDDFLHRLAQLPDPPEDFKGTKQSWIAPNTNKLFQIETRITR
jgi:hypothetical protein